MYYSPHFWQLGAGERNPTLTKGISKKKCVSCAVTDLPGPLPCSSCAFGPASTGFLYLTKLLSPVQEDKMQSSASSHSRYPTASTSVWSDLQVNPNFLPFFSLMQPIWAVPFFLDFDHPGLSEKRDKPGPPLGASNSCLLVASLTVKLSVPIIFVISLQDTPQHTRLFPDKPEQPSCSSVSLSHTVATTAFEETCRLFSVTNHLPFLSSPLSFHQLKLVHCVQESSSWVCLCLTRQQWGLLLNSLPFQ